MYELNGIILNERYVSYDSSFKKLLDSIYKNYVKGLAGGKNVPKGKGRPVDIDKHKYVIRVVISCLYYEWTHTNPCEHRCVRYNRNVNRYVSQSFSHKVALKVIEWMELNGYIKTIKGYYNRTESGNDSKTSRMVWSEMLSSSFYRMDAPSFFVEHTEPPIKIRDHNKDEVDADDLTSELFGSIVSDITGIDYIEMMKVINRVRLNVSTQVGRKNYIIAPYYRVYNNSALGEGGRFYGSAEQQANKCVRKLIQINHNPTVELDYSNLHISMLYDLEGISLLHDAYQVTNSKAELYNRSTIKGGLLAMLNAKTSQKSCKAIQRELNKQGSTKYKASNIYTDVSAHHKPISQYFGSGVGLELQYVDSEVALHVLYHFASKGILCLCIHDSFIVEDQYESELRDVMIEYYRHGILTKKFKKEEREGALMNRDKLFKNYLLHHKGSITIGIDKVS